MVFNLPDLPHRRRKKIMKQYFDATIEIVSRLKQGETAIVQAPRRHQIAAALLAFAQVIVDPFFATLDGFCVLLEKEFLYERSPMILNSSNTDFRWETSTLYSRWISFYLFLQGVAECRNQFPDYFEFKEELLLYLLEYLHTWLAAKQRAGRSLYYSAF